MVHQGRTKWLNALLGAVAFVGSPAWARCQSNQAYSLQDMVALRERELTELRELMAHNRTLAPELRSSTDWISARNHFWDSTVPKEFKIDQRRVAFTVSTLVGPAQVYWLPSTTLGGQNVGYGIGSSWRTYRDVAMCRVQAPDGRWWLVLQLKGGGLSYIRQDQTEPTSRK